MSADKKLKTPSRNFKKCFDENGVPACLRWTVQDVEDWVETELKFPQYKICFSSNFISGKKLIHMDASNLPKIGVTDFEHIKIITERIRDILGNNYPQWDRPITLPPKDTIEHFIERKSISGKKNDKLTFNEHERHLEEFNKHDVPE